MYQMYILNLNTARHIAFVWFKVLQHYWWGCTVIGCGAVLIINSLLTFRRSLLPPSTVLPRTYSSSTTTLKMKALSKFLFACEIAVCIAQWKKLTHDHPFLFCSMVYRREAGSLDRSFWCLSFITIFFQFPIL